MRTLAQNAADIEARLQPPEQACCKSRRWYDVRAVCIGLLYASLLRTSKAPSGMSLDIDKFDNGGSCLLTLFFHDPVARVGNDATCYVSRHKTRVFGHLCPERMICAERQHRHGQLAVGRECLVVDGILSKGRKLVESRMHRAGARIEFRVVAPRRLIDRFGIGGELVPEPIKVDTLAAFDQPLGIRSAEIEMPQSGAAKDFVPGARFRAAARRWRPSA